MKILLPFKAVRDPSAAGGNAASAGWMINWFDQIAIEEALRLQERGTATETVAVTIASASADEQVRSALAMGVNRVIRVDETLWLDPYTVARVLVKVVQREQPRLVMMGKQAVDDDANQTGQMLAGLLGWPQATFVSSVVLAEDARSARCSRETDCGLELIDVDLPSVITVDLRLNEPRYVSLPGLMKARRKPIEVITARDLGVPIAPATTLLAQERSQRRPSGIRVDSVRTLVERLRADQVIN